MKFPITDFANFACLPPLVRRTELVKFGTYKPWLHYWALRQALGGLLNLSSFERFMERPDFAHFVEVILKKANRSDLEERGKLVRLNLIATRAIFDWAVENDVHGVRERFGQFLYAIEGGIQPFEEAVIFVQGQPYILFLDLRIQNCLSPEGRKFVFSVMHEHIRVRNPDLAEVNLGILHLKKTASGRSVSIITADDRDLFSLSELQGMVQTMFEEIIFTQAA